MAQVWADLHTHSTASDGQYSPGALVEKAKERGIGVMALTDHDTFSGTGEAIKAGERLGVRVIRGVELGAREYRSLHILGYGFTPSPSSGLAKLCAKLRAGIEERKYRIVDFLKGKGVEIDLREVEALAQGDSVRRPHFAQVLVKRGYVQSNQEAFARYLDTDEYQKIQSFKASAQECIEAIRDAGGAVGFAHPYQVGLEDGPLEELVRALKGWGLEAIECYYPRHTPRQQAFYLELAKKYGLHPTGGSDFHGEKVKPDITLARLELDLDWLAARGYF